jgi:glycerophosphoryl diester phosphodiesterase
MLITKDSMTNSLITGSTFLFLFMLNGCGAAHHAATSLFPEFDFQGHRGARGLLPENTIPAFLKALELGTPTLEMDVVITKDKHVLVSHEAWMSSEICSKPTGDAVTPAEEKSLNIYQMTYAETETYDCGKRGHPRFAQQQPVASTKPLLRDVFSAEEKFTGKRKTIFYNIETKSNPDGDNRFHPEPKEFASLLYAEVKRAGKLGVTTFQSFDPRTLIELHAMDNSLRLALLVENEKPFEENLAALPFTPKLYCPKYQLVTPSLVQSVRAKGMKLVVWTVNSLDEMNRLVALGVDGIITDYPNLRTKLNVKESVTP